MKGKVKHQYYDLETVASLLSLSESDVNQFIITGQLVVAFVYHKPSDYREVREVAGKDGSVAKITRTKRTEFKVVSEDYKPIEISYLTHEDSARIILNKVENREILVNTLFFSNDRIPKNGRFLMGDTAVSVSKNELIVTREEIERFSKVARIKIKKIQVGLSQNGSKQWYDRPIGRTGLAIISIVIAGIIGAAEKLL